MFRAATISGLRQRGMFAAAKALRHEAPSRIRGNIPRNTPHVWRALSSEGKKKATQDKEEEMTQEIVLTPGEKVVAGTRLTMWAAAAALASVCAYYIGKELIPT